jgi:hypothetical protein
MRKLIGGANIKPYINKCKDVCKQGLDNLTSADQKYIVELMNRVPELYNMYELFAPKIFAHLQDKSSILLLLQLTTKYLKKKSTVKKISKLITTYGDIVKDERRMKAIGAYIVCILSNLDEEVREILVQSFELVMATVALVSNKEIATFAKDLGILVHKALVKPTVKKIKKTVK